MEGTTRLRINLISKEIEWQGSEEFINKYETTINEFIDYLKTFPTTKNLADDFSETPKNPQNQNADLILPNNFGEFYIKFPRSISITDKILVAAFFIQNKSSDGLFTPKEVSDLLNEQSVPVTNVNAFIKSLKESSKVYSTSGKYKVSEKGIELIQKMITN